MIFLQLLIQGIAVGAGYALVAAGFAIIYSATKTFHFAHGATYSLAAYSYYAAVEMWHLNPLWGILLAVVLAALFGMSVDALIYRPMRRTEASFLTLFAASFGILIVVTNALVLVFGNGFYSVNSAISAGMTVGAFNISLANILQVVVAFACICGLMLVLRYTRLGIFLRAMADSNALVEVFGFNSRYYASVAFFIGSLCVVPAAILNMYIGGIQPAAATEITLIAIAATIIGGIGSIPGAAVGGLILGIAENVGIWDLSSNWKPAISFGVLLLFLLARPSGLFGATLRRA